MRPAALRAALCALALLAGPEAAFAAPSGSPAPPSNGSTASTARQATFDPAPIIAEQMRLEKAGTKTGLFSRRLKAAYDAVPKDGDNLARTIFGIGYETPDRIVSISDLKYDDGPDPLKASATVTLHCNNPEAKVTSFNRTMVVAFVKEDGQWRIDDVRAIDRETAETRKAGRQLWIRAGLEATSGVAATPAPGQPAPSCAVPPMGIKPDSTATSAGFKQLTDIAANLEDRNHKTVAEMFVKPIGSYCPFSYSLVDLNGDGLADLVLQIWDTKLGATDKGMLRTLVYTLGKDENWRLGIDGMAREVLTRVAPDGAREVALAGNRGDGYRVWRWDGQAFKPV